jgi:hypothetical protein
VTTMPADRLFVVLLYEEGVYGLGKLHPLYFEEISSESNESRLAEAYVRHTVFLDRLDKTPISGAALLTEFRTN